MPKTERSEKLEGRKSRSAHKTILQNQQQPRATTGCQCTPSTREALDKIENRVPQGFQDSMISLEKKGFLENSIGGGFTLKIKAFKCRFTLLF